VSSAAQNAGPDSGDWRAPFQAPAVSLPTGGGAIRGMGEKFAANPVTGSSTCSIPLPASPGRGGFAPQLALSYDSGSGNGPFGFGWSLGLPAIARKTDKGLPRYTDETDTFLISGSEDLVPVLDAAGEIDDDALSAPGYAIRRYRPRIESGFARIERWTDTVTGDVHWRSISADNVLSIFGNDDAHRIADPANRGRVFSWLLSETLDDKGNAVVYDYRPEDGADLDLEQAHERQRGAADDPSRTANRYIERVRYGNAATLLEPGTLRRPLFLSQEAIDATRWMFELVFDYGAPGAADDVVGPWTRRSDPFSTYRAGFEVRTYRLCRRVLMFHDFPDDPAVGSHCLVRSLELTYRTTPQDSDSSDPGYSFLASATEWSHQRHDGDWHRRRLPPVDFTYSEAAIDDEVRDLDPRALENLPVGLGAGYQWVDLDGEGLSGILAEQAGAWYYKPNLGRGPNGPDFGPVRLMAEQPAMADLGAGRQQLLDVQGDGALNLVAFRPPAAGFHERDDRTGWNPFVPFVDLPNIDWDDRNLRFVDLTGDGLADALIGESDVFTWYHSRADRGFAPAAATAIPSDERDGPRIVFADSESAVYLADMSGDGLADIVRIRNGHVCYWPSLGYGRFGKQVVMDRSPRFDSAGQLDQRRLRLADVDGSGTTDLIYLGPDGATLWFNRSGNAWSAPRELAFPVATSNVGQIQAADLFGNGTACLVWSSDLPGDARRPFRYLDLMGGRKPHLMVEMRNNLGAVTKVDYVASTAFYLRDKAAGTPWITKLPFPVHCVEQVTVTDLHRKTVFANTYSYHHGYFDGAEREFRGFGRVEQVDTQRFDEFTAANADSPFVAADERLYQPPVKTITWFHTGIAAERSRILGSYEQEYFPSRYASRLAGSGFDESVLPQPEVESAGPPLGAGEWREAMRACKGMTLRQEVLELDVEALQDRGEHEPVRLFSAAQHACRIRRVQPRGPNAQAVFLVTEGEVVTYHYELDVGGAGALNPDPRVAHTLNLRFDPYGRVLQSVAAVYPRRAEHSDAALNAQQLALIRAAQAERHLAYTETRFTVELPADVDTHRLPAPCEVRTFELTGIDPEAGEQYFSVARLREFRLNAALDTQATTAVGSLDYHEQPTGAAAARKRLIEHVATLYFADDLSAPLALGIPSRLGLTYEVYKLALTASLVDAVFKGPTLTDPMAAEARAALGAAGARAGFLRSGYQTGAAIFGAPGGGETWWLRSGVAGFAADAAARFYLPERYLDPFGNETALVYDVDDLFVVSKTDARGNAATVEAFDHRVLSPARLKDANDNVNGVAFDIRGLPVATALMGKVAGGVAETGDTVAAASIADLNPSPADVRRFFASAELDEVLARRWLGRASARFVYHFGESTDAQGNVTWSAAPAGACSVAREQHERDLPNDRPELGAAGIPVQAAFEYSDGSGQAFVKKVQAEPDPAIANGPLRWIANGRSVVNNKGKPVLQYEPYFSTTGHRFEEPAAVGVSPVMFYDAPGRLARTEFPDGTLSRVELTPWFSRSFDQTDTVLEAGNRWYAERTAAAADAHDRRAARLAALSAETPIEAHFDSLGREVVTIAHNRTPSGEPAYSNVPLADRPWLDERILTFTKLDAEGKPLWICDARGNLVMQYVAPPRPNHTPLYDSPVADHEPAYEVPAGAAPCYDVAGNLLFQHSMDAGERWMLNDAAGSAMLAWDLNDRTLDDGTVTAERRRFETRYDVLHRPVARWLRINTRSPALIEAFEYVDAESFTSAAGVPDQAALAAARRRNLIGHAVAHYDPSGLATVERVDTRGTAEEVTRRLLREVEAPVVDWNVADRATVLEGETFRQITEHDALDRVTTLYNWHRDVAGQPGSSDRVAVYVTRYNERGVVESETLHVRATKQPGADGRPTFQPHADAARSMDAIRRVTWNAKGQKLSLERGNGTTTRYTYDTRTSRLVHLYTRRDATYAGDCVGDADSERPPRPCGVQNLHYTYDPVGNIAHIQDDAQDTIWFANQQVEPSNDYVYDALYRLIEATGRENAAAVGSPPHPEGTWPTGSFPSPDSTRNYTQRYRYDAVGNLLRMRHIAGSFPGQPAGSWTRDYAYAYDDPTQPASNRLWQTWLGGDRTGAITYRHDRHGSMLNLANTPPGVDIRWDWRDMVRALDLEGGGEGRYSYDIEKQRTRKRLARNPSEVEDRIYLGQYELYRRYGAEPGEPVEEIESHHLLDGDHRALLVDDVLLARQPRRDGLSVSPRTLWRYQLGNHLGSATVELDEAARVITHEELHVHGTTAYRLLEAAAEAPPKRYRHTGMERDDESGLSYHGARFFAPWLARWSTCDPKGLVDGPNVYMYAQGRATRLVDSTGFAGKETEAQRIGREAQRLGAKNEDLWKKFQTLVNELRTELGYPKRSVSYDVSPHEGSANEMDEFVRKGKTVREHKAMGILSERNSTVAKRLENLKKAQAQVLGYVKEARAKAGVVIQTWYGKISPSKLASLKDETKVLDARTAVTSIGTLRARIKTLERLVERVAQSKTAAHLVSVGKHVSKPVVAIVAVVGLAGTAQAATSGAEALQNRDYGGAAKGLGTAGLDVIEMTPTPAGAVTGAGRGGWALGEALGEGLGIGERAQKTADTNEESFVRLGASKDTARTLGAASASLAALGDFATLISNPAAMTQRISEEMRKALFQ
jgi:RHS repeat-associated protein